MLQRHNSQQVRRLREVEYGSSVCNSVGGLEKDYIIYMKIRTISDLPEITGINSDDLFMVSRESADNAWSSKKLTYETLETAITDTALVSALNSISVAEGTNVGKRLDYVDGLSAEVSVYPDYVKFTHAPRISNASA